MQKRRKKYCLRDKFTGYGIIYRKLFTIGKRQINLYETHLHCIRQEWPFRCQQICELWRERPIWSLNFSFLLNQENSLLTSSITINESLILIKRMTLNVFIRLPNIVTIKQVIFDYYNNQSHFANLANQNWSLDNNFISSRRCGWQVTSNNFCISLGDNNNREIKVSKPIFFSSTIKPIMSSVELCLQNSLDDKTSNHLFATMAKLNLLIFNNENNHMKAWAWNLQNRDQLLQQW
jgi:hypothetical protein